MRRFVSGTHSENSLIYNRLSFANEYNCVYLVKIIDYLSCSYFGCKLGTALFIIIIIIIIISGGSRNSVRGGPERGIEM